MKRRRVDLRTVLTQGDAVQRLTELGTYLEAMSPDELTAFIRRQQQAWKPVLTAIADRTPKGGCDALQRDQPL